MTKEESKKVVIEYDAKGREIGYKNVSSISSDAKMAELDNTIAKNLKTIANEEADYAVVAKAKAEEEAKLLAEEKAKTEDKHRKVYAMTAFQQVAIDELLGESKCGDFDALKEWFGKYMNGDTEALSEDDCFLKYFNAIYITED